MKSDYSIGCESFYRETCFWYLLKTCRSRHPKINQEKSTFFKQIIFLFIITYLPNTTIITMMFSLSLLKIFFFYLIGPLFYCCKRFLFFSYSNRSELEYFNDPRSYPLCCWMPFTVENYWTFVALCVLMFSVLLSAISIYLIIDTYFFGAIYIIGGQFDLLTETLSSIQHCVDNG